MLNLAPLSIKEIEQYLEEEDSIDLAKGVSYEKIALLLADYLDQLGAKGIEKRLLTVEFFLPLNLMNKALEQCAIPGPAGWGEHMPLGLQRNCAHVLLRSQDRLEGGFKRCLPTWERKWKILQSSATAETTFVDGDRHKIKLGDKLESDEVFGLSLSKPPTLSRKGEIAMLLITGTPAAIWLRCQTTELSLCDCLHSKVLSGNLSDVSRAVWSLRQQTPKPEGLEDLESSAELGHHLSFMWENPERVPPTINYFL